MALRFTLFILPAVLVFGNPRATALDEPRPGAPAALVTAYPDFLNSIDGGDLVWKDGTRTRIDHGKGPKTFAAMLNATDINDMFALSCPAGRKRLAPESTF